METALVSSSSDAPRKDAIRGLPWTVWAAAALFVLILLPRIDAGTLWHHDELLTANRSREILVRGDPLAVTLNFAPSVKKPPLQYWCGALLLRWLPRHPELAVRLPSLLGGAACLLAAAWLARIYFPADPQLAAWTACALDGCGYLIHFSRVALLDTGAATFFTLALGGFHLARRDGRWWWFVALQCVLGAWQKAPYGLLACPLLFLLDRQASPISPESERRWRQHLPRAAVFAVAGSLSWWLVQYLRADPSLLATAGKEQASMFLRAHDAANGSDGPWIYGWWMVRDWTLLGLSAIAATAAAVAETRRGGQTVGLGWVCLVFGGVMACLPYRAERYLVVITPALAVLSVAWLRQQSRRLGPVVGRWLLPAVCFAALPVAAFHYCKPTPDYPDLRATAQALGKTARPGERLFVCNDAAPDFESAGFVLFYANLRRPLEMVPLQFLVDLPEQTTPRRGVCTRFQWARLRESQTGLKAVFAAGEWVLWSNERANAGSDQITSLVP